jgi:hypothetical protein
MLYALEERDIPGDQGELGLKARAAVWSLSEVTPFAALPENMAERLMVMVTRPPAIGSTLLW